jgi:hypothetical protein
MCGIFTGIMAQAFVLPQIDILQLEFEITAPSRLATKHKESKSFLDHWQAQ